MAEVTEKGNIIRDFSIGNTHVKICDDYCRDQTAEDVDIILRRISQRALRGFSKTAATIRHASS